MAAGGPRNGGLLAAAMTGVADTVRAGSLNRFYPKRKSAYPAPVDCAGMTRRISRVTVNPCTMMENSTTM